MTRGQNFAIVVSFVGMMIRNAGIKINLLIQRKRYKLQRGLMWHGNMILSMLKK